jgi:hypothetical protein
MAKRLNAIGQMRTFLKRHDWEYVADDEQRMLRGSITGENGQWNWVATQTRDDRFLMFCACSPVKASPRKRAAVAEFLTRANWYFQFGNFEMDWSDGQVVLRTSIPITATRVMQDTIGHLVFGNCSLMDRYLRGLLAVTLGNVKPAQAVDDAQHISDEPASEDDVVAAAHNGSPTSDSSGGIPERVTPSRLDGLSPGNN